MHATLSLKKPVALIATTMTALAASLALACGAITLGACAPQGTGLVQDAHAQTITKAGWYGGCCVDYTGNDISTIRNAAWSGNKITVKGLLDYKRSSHSYAQTMDNAVRTFKIAKNVRCYSCSGMDGISRQSISYIMSGAKEHSGLYLQMKVKNGKIVRMELCS